MPVPIPEVKKFKTSVWIFTFADLLMLLFCFFALIVLLKPPQRTVNLSIASSNPPFQNQEYLETKVKIKKNGESREALIKHLVGVDVQEGSDPQQKTEVVIQASIDSEAKKPLEVYYEVYNTATASSQSGKDFNLLDQGPIKINVGQTKGTARIQIESDSYDEVEETLLVSMTKVTNAKPGDANKLKINIVDDDPPPQLNLKLTSKEIGPGETAVLEGRLSQLSEQDIEVPITLLGTAKPDQDFTISQNKLIFRPGTLQNSINFHINEQIQGLPKRINIQIEGTDTARLSPPFNQTIVIVEKSKPQFVNLELERVQKPSQVIRKNKDNTEILVREGVGTISFRATISAALTRRLLVPFKVYDPKQTFPDYELKKRFLTIPPGRTSASETIRIIDDQYQEPDDEIVIQMEQVEGVQKGKKTSLKITIQDNDRPPTLDLKLSPREVNPGEAVVLTASLSPRSLKEVKLPVLLKGIGDININEVFKTFNKELHFPPGVEETKLVFEVKPTVEQLPKKVTFGVTPTNLVQRFSFEESILIREAVEYKNCDVLKNYMDDNRGVFDKFLLHQDKTRCRISLPSDLSFMTGTAKINDQGGLLEAIKKLASTIKTFYPRDHIIVAGHTDQQAFRGNDVEKGIYRECRSQGQESKLCNNWELSSMRAAVVAVLLLKEQIPKTKVAIESHADNQPSPLDPKWQRADQALHRRVEIMLVDPPGQKQKPRLLFAPQLE